MNVENMENASVNSTLHINSHLKVNNALTNTLYFRVPFGALMVVLFITSLSGGLFVCYVMHKNKMAKKKAWLYLLILTVSDTGGCLFEIPIMFAASVEERILAIRPLCILSGSVLTFCSLLSIYSLAAISFHRYRTISRPFESLGNTGKRDVIVFLIISLIIATILSVSPAAGFSRYTYWPGRKWCVFQSRKPKLDIIYAGMIVLLGYVIPIGTIIASSVRIVFIVKEQRGIRVESRRVSQDVIVAEHRAMIKTISLLIGAFFILWTPTLIYFVAGLARVSIPLWYSHIVYFLMLLQGTVNTTIYCFRHEVFKKELNIIFCRNTEIKNWKSSLGSEMRTRSVTMSSTESVANVSHDIELK